jgi:hypothetical protein
MDKYLESEPPGEVDLARTDQVDTAGHAIVKLLHKAADAGEAKTRQTAEAARGLSNRLHAAKERITELEADLQSFHEKVDRAEQWLAKISTKMRIG